MTKGSRAGLSDSLSPPPEPWKECSLAALAYAALTALFFAPVLGDFGESLIGPPEDNLRAMWTMWWGHGALLGDLGDLLSTDIILFPEGASLRYNDYSWYNLFVALPLRQLLSAPATYNLLVLHSFVLAGVGAYLLSREVGASGLAAFAGGFVFAFSPMHVIQSQHHLNIASIQWIPFFALFFLRALRGGGRRDVALAAVFFLLNGLCSWNHLIFTSYFVALATLGRGLSGGISGFTAALRTAVSTTAPALLLLAVWLVPMAYEGYTAGGATPEGHELYVVDALGPVVPHYRHVLSRIAAIGDINRSYVGLPWESVGYLGIAALALAGIGLIGRAAGAVPAALGALAFLVLAMGSRLHVGGVPQTVPMPYQLLEALPLVSSARVPGRAMVFVYLFLGVLVAGGLQTLRKRCEPRTYWALAIGATLFLVADYFTPVIRSSRVFLPPAYEVIVADQDSFAILELPLSWRATNHHMMYQSIHGVPIVGGQLPRKTAVRTADAIREAGLDFDWESLAALRVKYVVVDAALFDAPGAADAYRERFREAGFASLYDAHGTFVVRTY